MMVQAIHFDGFILVVASLALAMLGQTYHRWPLRVPLFAMAFFDFALAINLMGLYRPVLVPIWLWLRMGADSATFVVVAIHFMARRPQMHLPHVHQAFHPHPHAVHQRKVAGQR